MDQALFEALRINSLRAAQKRMVKEKFYKHRDTSSVGEILRLTEDEYYILEQEQLWNDSYGSMMLPTSISAKQCAALLGCHVTTVYRYIKAGKLTAIKCNRKWEIITCIEALDLAA